MILKVLNVFRQFSGPVYTAVLWSTLIFISCENPFSPDPKYSTKGMTKARVEIQAIDNGCTSSSFGHGENRILSIYDPTIKDATGKETDYRWVYYGTNRTAVFTDVIPGYYKAHFSGDQSNGRSIWVTVNSGDDLLITFTCKGKNYTPWAGNRN